MVGSIEQLSIMAVLDRGVPNEECIAVKANEDVNLGQYGLMLGVAGGEGKGAWPQKDNLLWFGDGWIKKDDWLFVYTGTGRAHSTKGTKESETFYSVYWGREHTIFHAIRVVPILFRVDAVVVGDPAPAPDGSQRTLPPA